MKKNEFLIKKRYKEVNWRHYLDYDESSPTGLIWLNPLGYKMKKGDIAGFTNSKDGRYSVQLSGKKYECSLIVWSLFNELNDGFIIDHIDGNPANNKIENLRQVTCAENMRNVKKKVSNKTGKVGVHLIKTEFDSYYVASWIDLNGVRKTVNYSVKRLGDINAFHLATYTRDYFLKINGNYSDRHGQ